MAGETQSKDQSEDSTFLVVLFPRSSENPYLRQVKSWLETDPTLAVYEANSIEEIGKQVAQYNRAVLVFGVTSKPLLVEVLNCVSTHQRLIKEHFLRVIGFNTIEHPEVNGMLMKKGVADIFAHNLSQKAFRHKITQCAKILERYQENQAQLASAVLSKNERSKQNQDYSKRPSALQRVPAIEQPSDCWIIRNERDVRFVQGKWLIDAVGPGPSVGFWEEGATTGSWIWKNRPDPDHIFTSLVEGEGQWVFVGRKPEFLWHENICRFIGERASLSWVLHDKTNAVRFQWKNPETFEVAENSSQAMAKLPLIKKSFEGEHRFKYEKAKQQASDVFENDVGRELQATESETGLPESRAGVFEEVPTPQLKVWFAEDAQGKNAIEATAIEFSSEELLAELPPNLFASGQKIFLIFDNGLGKVDSRSQMESIIADVQSCEGISDLVRVHPAHGAKMPVSSVQDVYKDRQAEIQDFLKSARGW